MTSLCIGLSYFSHTFEVLTLVFFVIGLSIVVWAGILAYLEMRMSHQVVVEEVKELRLRS